MIFIDTETTGLLKPSANELKEQPHIIELYALKLDDELNFVDEIETFLNPGVPIEEHITKITNITDEMVRHAPTFPEIYERLSSFFLGERAVVAHNAPFDMGMLWAELARMEREFHFPWPIDWICTVEKSMHLENKRLKLSRLHEILRGEPHVNNAHRAKPDVHALVRCYVGLKERGFV